ncbi:MAG: methyltransferase domain-containing protein [Candidatus Protochlamydia sp.]|nr:methyltransferase domain-containing protein [Candidatus Protochlamydia sp.]
MNFEINQFYSHTQHFVDLSKFNNFINDLLNSEKFDLDKKSKLQSLIGSDVWKQIQQSTYWRHNIFNGGLSGPFTEYFACFNPQWKTDFWGGDVQPLDITYLSEHAIPRAYQSAVFKTQQILFSKSKEFSNNRKFEVATLACGTMYDVLGASYEDRKKVFFCGYDVDKESLSLVKEKAIQLKYDDEQIELCECDIVTSSLPKDHYDTIICNGFSFYIYDEQLCQVIENVKQALKSNGIFVMSFIQPPHLWQMDEEEKKVSAIYKEILDLFPKKWSAHLRTGDHVLSILEKSGLANVSVLEERHGIHPLVLAHKI